MVPKNWLNDSVALKNKQKNYIEVLKVLFSLLSIQLLPFLSLCLCFFFFFGMGNIWTRHLPSLLSPTQTSDHCEALNSRFANRADRVDWPPTGGGALVAVCSLS